MQALISPDMKRSDDDGYCYYLCFKWSVITGAFFSFLNLISLVLSAKIDFLIFKINLHETRYVREFTFSYPFYTSAFIFLVILPFFYFKTRANIPQPNDGQYNDYDPLWWNLRLNRKLFPAKILKERSGGLFFLSVFFLFTCFSFGNFFIVIHPSLQVSKLFFGILLILYPFIIGIISSSALSSLVAWRFYVELLGDRNS